MRTPEAHLRWVTRTVNGCFECLRFWKSMSRDPEESTHLAQWVLHYTETHGESPLYTVEVFDQDAE
jgi:hypothetical protein